MTNILVTGSAGFIGFHLVRRLLAQGHEVTGYDGMTAYYDVGLKRARHDLLKRDSKFTAIEARLEERAALERAVAARAPEIIVHLAAQAGVRYGLEDPQAYIDANLAGTFALLEAARAHPPAHLLIASTSAIYGGNQKTPFAEADRTDFPVSLYGATKKAGEALSHSHAHLFNIPTTCFRFFTVYGPWGRPDMALFKFVAAIERGEAIEIYGRGEARRDFTYIEDLVEAILRLMPHRPRSGQPVVAEGVRDSLSPVAPWRAVNIAGGRPVGLMDFIAAIEAGLGRVAEKRFLPPQAGDVPATAADAGLLLALTNFRPQTDLHEGVGAFIDWYRGWRQEEAGSKLR